MPIFEVQGPDGKTYEADAPSMEAAASAFGPQPDRGTAANVAFGGLEPALHFLSSMVAKPVSDVAGLAATGYDALTGNPNTDAEGFKQYVQDALTVQPQTATGQAITNAVSKGAGAVLKPISAYTNWAGDFYANAAQSVGAPRSVVEAVKTGETEAAGQTLNLAGAEAPGTVINATRTAAGNVLRRLEAGADPALQKSIAEAQAVAPDMQTVAQTTGRPSIKFLGAQAAGKTTAQASKQIVDSLTQGLVDQSKKLAPLGVDAPETASRISDAIQKNDETIASRQDKVFTAGRDAVAKQPGEVSLDNLIGTFDKMKAEAEDPRNLSAPPLPPKLEPFIDSLRDSGGFGGKPIPGPHAGAMTGEQPLGGAPTSTGTASWGEFFDIRKELNSLYKTIPKDQITPALDQVFSRLKSAYYQDLAAAPAVEAKRLTQKTFGIYEGLAAKRAELSNSVVASALGKDSANALSNPDGVLDRLTTAAPAAQTYMRNILERYAPDALDSLRAYWIDKRVQAAGRGTSDPTVSATNPTQLTPGQEGGRALFTDEQLKELDARQSALNVAVGALAERGATAGTHIDPQAVGRITFGGFNPTFVGGALTKLLSAGKLEKYLNTPEGRNALLAPPKAGPTATPTRLFMSSVLARVAAERQAAQAAQQQGQPSP